MATITTRAEIINPWSMGAAPDWYISLKLVFRPMAPRDATIRNLLISFRAKDKDGEMNPRLFINARARNPKINHGNRDENFIFALISPFKPVAAASLRLRRTSINAKMITVGMMDNVRVSFTMVAKSPAASEKAYPAATTLEVSLTAVPDHNGKQQNHCHIKQEGGRHGIGNVPVPGIYRRCNGGYGRTSADTCSGRDQI